VSRQSFFEESAGLYRYKQKELGVVQDTLVAIRKAFKKGATNVVKKSTTKMVKKATKDATEKASKKL